MPQCWILLLASAAYVWFFCVYLCVYMCASLQTPAQGLKLPFHPQRKQSPNTSVNDPSFYCSHISLYPPHLPLYFIIFILISSSPRSNLILHFLALFYHFMSIPLLLSVVLILSFLIFLPFSQFYSFAFCMRYSYRNPLISPFLFSPLFPVSVLSFLLFTSNVT